MEISSYFYTMLRFITFVTLLSCALAGPRSSRGINGRIVGGEEAPIEKHPHMVTMQYRGGEHICGGSLIRPDIVLTAGHCVKGMNHTEFFVRMGTRQQSSLKGIDVNVTSFIAHDYGYHFNDVAVLKLEHPVVESDTVKCIEMADEFAPTGALAVTTGWGYACLDDTCGHIDIDYLREVYVNIIDWYTCDQNYFDGSYSVTPNNVCAVAPGKDSCNGDSGGPLVVDNKLVGIVSWGIGCADPEYPGVYADVTYFRNWIEKTISML